MKNICKLLILICLWLLLISCRSPVGTSVSQGTTGSANETDFNQNQSVSARVPIIEVEPFKAADGNYKILIAATFKVSVSAPGAQETDLLYQPVTVKDRQVKLRSRVTQIDVVSGRFETEVQTSQDFNGEVWARVRYPDGEIKETERLQLAAQSKNENNSNGREQANSAINKQVDDNESARADRKTGGRIERAALQPGNGNVRITINVPAFTLTLWQDDKEIKNFYVGVGRRSHPIPSGSRTADEIILNPEWIPPDSEWVRESSDVESYERIPASSSDNPIGKIKFPLGSAYLLHEAQDESDVGNLVSHGCVRVLRDDIYQLARLIVQAHSVSISDTELDASKKDNVRRVIKLRNELQVDINYDTMVVMNGVLHIYPDVYEQKTNTVEELRAELESYRIDVSKLDDGVLKKMLDSVDSKTKYVVSLEDIRAGRVLEKGKTEPLTPYQAKNDQQNQS